MTGAPLPTPRRVLLGIGETRESAAVLDAATRVARGFGTAVECLVVAHEDMLSVAGLPFARAFGTGGVSMPMTASGMEGYFRRLAQTVEKDLTARCQSASLQWHLERQSGTLLGQVSGAVQEGDVVVVGRRDLQAAAGNKSGVLRNLLEKAAAVVLPATRSRTRGRTMLLPGLGAEGAALARGMAAALGAGLAIEEQSDHAILWQQASLIVARIGPADTEGDGDVLMELDDAGVAAVLLPPQVRKS